MTGRRLQHRLGRRRAVLAAAAPSLLFTWCLGAAAPAFGPAAPPKKAPVGPAPPSRDPSSEEPLSLLGKEAWRFNEWRAETDDVRGGASTASFKGVAETSGNAELSGVLDSTALGNSFASVSLQAKALPESLAEMKGLVLNVVEADGRDYAVALRMLGAPAGVQHVFRFTAKSAGPVEMLFRDFKPMLRGKLAPEPQTPLVLERVEALTLQTGSDIGSEDGPFSLVLGSVLGIPGRELPPPPPPARKTKWTCHACGTMNFDSAKSCTRCGESRTAKQDKAERAAKEEARKKPVKWDCSACGWKNFPGASECDKCGAPRD